MKEISIVVGSLAFGGAERITTILASWLKDKNYKVNIVTINKADQEYDLEKNIKRISLHHKNNFISKIKYMRNSLKGSDVVLVMGVPLLTYVKPSLIGLSIPCIVSERNDPTNFKGKKIIKYVSRFLMNFNDGYVFQTDKAREFYSSIIQRKSVVIPNPLIKDKIPAVFGGKRKKKIVNVGRLVTQKNHLLLIEAFSILLKNHPEYTLTIYGEGPERSKLEQKIKELNISDSVFLPGISSKVLDEIKKAELFVLSSDFEGIPNALIEALALGLPSISTDTPSGGPRYLIKHGKNGMLVPTNNVKALVESMEELIINEALAHRLSKNATKIIDKLDKDVICNQWLNYIVKITK